MDLSVKPIEIKEVEPGVVALFRGDRPMMCPFINRTVIPVPKNSGIMTGGGQAPQVAVDSMPCNSQCALFQLYKSETKINSVYSSFILTRSCSSCDLLFDKNLKQIQP